MHHEDQVRVLFSAIGHETVEGFLKRFPAERRDFVAAIGNALGNATGTGAMDPTFDKSFAFSGRSLTAVFMPEGTLTIPSVASETEQARSTAQE